MERRKFATQCFDQVTGKTGCFFYDIEKYSDTGKFYSIGDVFPGLYPFFSYAHSIGFHLDPLTINEMVKK